MISVITALVNDIKNLICCLFKNVDEDIAIVKNVNNKSVEYVKDTERQCWSNTKYSWFEFLEVISIPTSINVIDLEQMVCDIFEVTDVEVGERDIHPCHCLKKDKDRTL